MLKLKSAMIIVICAALISMPFEISFADNKADGFTDIANSWAKSYIANVLNRGLMDGISNSLFKPEDNMRSYDVIVSIGRMLKASENADLAALESKYKEKVLDKFKVPVNVRKEVAFCLEKGIISDLDVSIFSNPNKQYASKTDICVYIGRAMLGQVDANKNKAELRFNDKDFIPTMYRPYVDYMVKIGAIDGKGDLKGNFNPYSTVTRAAFAKIIDIADKEFNKVPEGESPQDGSPSENGGNTGTPGNNNSNTQNPNEPSPESGEAKGTNSETVQQKNLTRVKGRVDSITFKRGGAHKITVEVGEGVMKEYVVPSTLGMGDIIIEGRLSDIYSLRPDMQISIDFDGDRMIRIVTGETVTPVSTEGVIKSVDAANSAFVIQVYDDKKLQVDKKVYAIGAKIADKGLNMLSMKNLQPGQKVIVIGIENSEGITAQTVIILN